MRPRDRGLLDGRLPELLAAALVATTGLVLTAMAAGLLVAVLALLPVALDSLPALVVLGLVVGAGALGSLTVAATAWVAVRSTRRAARSAADGVRMGLYERALRIEEELPLGGRLGLSSRFRPDEETVVETLQRRYVEGDLDEAAFERELERLLGTGEAVDVRPRTGRTAAGGDAGPEQAETAPEASTENRDPAAERR